MDTRLERMMKKAMTAHGCDIKPVYNLEEMRPRKWDECLVEWRPGCWYFWYNDENDSTHIIKEIEE